MLSATISLGSSNRPSTPRSFFSSQGSLVGPRMRAWPTRALQFSLSFCSGVAEAALLLRV